MMMKRKRSSSREAMERTEFSKDATRLLKEFQYLRTHRGCSAASPPLPSTTPRLCALRVQYKALVPVAPGLGLGSGVNRTHS